MIKRLLWTKWKGRQSNRSHWHPHHLHAKRTTHCEWWKQWSTIYQQNTPKIFIFPSLKWHWIFCKGKTSLLWSASNGGDDEDEAIFYVHILLFGYFFITGFISNRRNGIGILTAWLYATCCRIEKFKYAVMTSIISARQLKMMNEYIVH